LHEISLLWPGRQGKTPDGTKNWRIRFKHYEFAPPAMHKATSTVGLPRSLAWASCHHKINYLATFGTLPPKFTGKLEFIFF
jgi:hypothetical protein